MHTFMMCVHFSDVRTVAHFIIIDVALWIIGYFLFTHLLSIAHTTYHVIAKVPTSGGNIIVIVIILLYVIHLASCSLLHIYLVPGTGKLQHHGLQFTVGNSLFG